MVAHGSARGSWLTGTCFLDRSPCAARSTFPRSSPLCAGSSTVMPALRTTVGSRDGEPRQSVQDETNADVAFIDASAWSHQALRESVKQEVSRPMALEGGALVPCPPPAAIESGPRAGPDRSSRDRRLLVGRGHVERPGGVLRCGTGRAIGPASPSRRVVCRLRQPGAAVAARRRRLSRCGTIGGSSFTGRRSCSSFHGDRVRPPVRTFRGATCWSDVEPEVVRQLKALAKTHGVTLFAVLLAAYQALLHRHTGHTDLLVGVPVANRRDASWRRLVGYFVNLVVMRGDLSGNPTFATLLDRTKSTLAGALAHQDLPFPALVERLRPERDLSRPPVVQCSLVVLSDHGFNRPGIAALAAGARDTLLCGWAISRSRRSASSLWRLNSISA